MSGGALSVKMAGGVVQDWVLIYAAERQDENNEEKPGLRCHEGLGGVVHVDSIGFTSHKTGT